MSEKRGPKGVYISPSPAGREDWFILNELERYKKLYKQVAEQLDNLRSFPWELMHHGKHEPYKGQTYEDKMQSMQVQVPPK